jgi:hypothetical protein
VIGVALLVEASLGPQPAHPAQWFLGAMFLVLSPCWLVIGRNAKRAARDRAAGSGQAG